MMKVTTPRTYNLKPLSVASTVPAINTECTITGWGRTEGPKDPVYSFAQKATVKVLPMNQCEKIFNQIPKNTLCFGGMGVAACQVSGNG